MRYRALGTACYHDRIRSLLVAHHEDDIAETILVRLAQGHQANGLQGMSVRAAIPECYGLYGVQAPKPIVPRPGTLTTDEEIVEGVSLLRPLLGFSKSRLIATCQEASIDWVEDQTNTDVTVTIRNAARKLLASKKLPVALQKPSLLGLSRAVKTKAQERQKLADQLFRACDVQRPLDLRSGSMSVMVPRPEAVFGPDLTHQWSAGLKRDVLSQCLRRLCDFVSPEDLIELQCLENAIQLFFSSEFPTNIEQNGQDPRTFTVAKVMFTPKSSHMAQGTLWQMHRQPFLLSNRPGHSPRLCYTASSFEDEQVSKFRAWHAQLWDGRFWIKLENRTGHDIMIIPFTEKHHNALRRSSSSKARDRLEEKLQCHVPGKIRYTLPVIVAVEDGQTEANADVMALPTLDFINQTWKGKLRWEVEYKNLVQVSRTVETISDC